MNFKTFFQKEVQTTEGETPEIQAIKEELSLISTEFYQTSAVANEGSAALNILSQREQELITSLERMDRNRILGNLDVWSFEENQKELREVKKNKVIVSGQLEPLKIDQARLSARMNELNQRILQIERTEIVNKYDQTRQNVLDHLSAVEIGLRSMKNQLIEFETKPGFKGLNLLGRTNPHALENYVSEIRKFNFQLESYLNLTKPR